MPYLLMRHVATGRMIWIANFHNPATTPSRRPSKWRAKAKAKQVALANRLHQSGVPLIITGDMNERGRLPLLDDVARTPCARPTAAPRPVAAGPPATAHRLIFGSDS